jgi:hypothetical protein
MIVSINKTLICESCQELRTKNCLDICSLGSILIISPFTVKAGYMPCVTNKLPSC